MIRQGGPARPHVVVVGGGFAGLNAAQASSHAHADVTLVDRDNYHTFQPLFYQVSTGTWRSRRWAWRFARCSAARPT